MADPRPTPEAMARAALDALHAQRAETDNRIAELIKLRDAALQREGPAASAQHRSQIEAAILHAETSRELAATVVAATEIIDSTIKTFDARLADLNARIADFTVKADEGTSRLGTWTIVLAVATFALVLVAGAQVWVTWASAPPQFFTLPSSPMR